MSRLVFMLEEPSMKALLEGLLPRLFPGLEFFCIPHEGKSDLEASLQRKLANWRRPDDRFVVIRDNDGGDCRVLKSTLARMCLNAGRSDSLVRIVCQELEAWYFGDPAAMAIAFENERLGMVGNRARFRDPDAIRKPSRELAKLHHDFRKIDGARRMAACLTYVNNKSRSFRALIEGVARTAGMTLPA